MSHQPRWRDGNAIPWPLGKILCVGRNYAEHARELGNPQPAEPILFLKPATAAVDFERPWPIPTDRGACHVETELALLIGQPLCWADAAQTWAAIAGYGIGLDLTLRELQNRLKQAGHPWEVAKAFDGSCPLTPFIPAAELGDPTQLRFTLELNGRLQQRGEVTQMLFSIPQLLQTMSHHFTLLPGDVVLTGTPAGVTALQPGDRLQVTLANAQWQGQVAETG